VTSAVEEPSVATSRCPEPSSRPDDRTIGTTGPARRSRTARWALPFALAVLAGAAACSTTPGPGTSRPTGPGDTSSSGSPSTSPAASPSAGPDEPSTPAEPPPAGVTEVRVLVGGQAFAAELYDNPTARDLAGRLPVTLTVDDLNGAEKTGRLPFALTTNGVPRGADPEVDEIGYYAPGQDLVLYYGDVGYFNGIIRIGRFQDSIESIGDRPDGLAVTLQGA
jgi:hypothetical protein